MFSSWPNRRWIRIVRNLEYSRGGYHSLFSCIYARRTHGTERRTAGEKMFLFLVWATSHFFPSVSIMHRHEASTHPRVEGRHHSCVSKRAGCPPLDGHSVCVPTALGEWSEIGSGAMNDAKTFESTYKRHTRDRIRVVVPRSLTIDFWHTSTGCLAHQKDLLAAMMLRLLLYETRLITSYLK